MLLMIMRCTLLCALVLSLPSRPAASSAAASEASQHYEHHGHSSHVRARHREREGPHAGTEVVRDAEKRQGAMMRRETPSETQHEKPSERDSQAEVQHTSSGHRQTEAGNASASLLDSTAVHAVGHQVYMLDASGKPVDVPPDFFEPLGAPGMTKSGDYYVKGPVPVMDGFDQTHGAPDYDQVCHDDYRLHASCGGCGPGWGHLMACKKLCEERAGECNFFAWWTDQTCALYTACVKTVTNYRHNNVIIFAKEGFNARDMGCEHTQTCGPVEVYVRNEIKEVGNCSDQLLAGGTTHDCLSTDANFKDNNVTLENKFVLHPVKGHMHAYTIEALDRGWCRDRLLSYRTDNCAIDSVGFSGSKRDFPSEWNVRRIMDLKRLPDEPEAKADQFAIQALWRPSCVDKFLSTAEFCSDMTVKVQGLRHDTRSTWIIRPTEPVEWIVSEWSEECNMAKRQTRKVWCPVQWTSFCALPVPEDFQECPVVSTTEFTLTTTMLYYHDFWCTQEYNFLSGLNLTDGKGGVEVVLTRPCNEMNLCDFEPVYGNNGIPDLDKAASWCMSYCRNDVRGCTGFFLQRKKNGEEVCGFYTQGLDEGKRVHRRDGIDLGGRVCRQLGYVPPPRVKEWWELSGLEKPPQPPDPPEPGQLPFRPKEKCGHTTDTQELPCKVSCREGYHLRCRWSGTCERDSGCGREFGAEYGRQEDRRCSISAAGLMEKNLTGQVGESLAQEPYCCTCHEGADFKLISSGTCEELGLLTILAPETCKLAAEILTQDKGKWFPKDQPRLGYTLKSDQFPVGCSVEGGDINNNPMVYYPHTWGKCGAGGYHCICIGGNQAQMKLVKDFEQNAARKRALDNNQKFTAAGHEAREWDAQWGKAPTQANRPKLVDRKSVV